MEENTQNESYTLLIGSAEENVYPDVAYYFDVITEHTINIENQITDNYLENNTAIQDAIAHSPITISLSGLIGELVYVPSTNNRRFLNELYKSLNDKNRRLISDYVVTDKLSAIAQLYPPVDNLTQLAKNAVVYIEDSIDRYKKIYKNFVRNINDKTRLQDVFDKLLEFRTNNIPFIAITPFGQFGNMYIQSISLTQGNENHIANLNITLKQLNFTEINVTAPDKEVLARYNKQNQAMVENYGKADGYSADSSAYNMIGKPFYNEVYRFKQ